MSTLAGQLLSSAQTLARKGTEPRTAKKIERLAHAVSAQSSAAAQALTLLDRMIEDSAVRMPYPGLEEVRKRLRAALA